MAEKKRDFSEARKQANQKWDSVNLDRMSIALPAGTKDRIEKAAEQAGMSKNAWIREKIEQALEASGV